MTLQFDTATRNAAIDAYVAEIGADPILEFRTGTAPANCAASSTGTVLATIQLPTVWMGAASGGAASKAGTWEDPSADATGTAGHFRLFASDGTTCKAQGTVTASGGGGDMIVTTVSFVATQPVEVLTFVLTEGNG